MSLAESTVKLHAMSKIHPSYHGPSCSFDLRRVVYRSGKFTGAAEFR